MSRGFHAAAFAPALLTIAACAEGPSAAPPSTPPPAAEPPPTEAARAVGATQSQGAGVNGRIAPEVVQKIVRGGFGGMRTCYDEGLRRNAGLQGRVVTKFVVDRDGRVVAAVDGGSDIPDPRVVECVVLAFAGLRFPPPEGGVVTVVYPIQFKPGD